MRDYNGKKVTPKQVAQGIACMALDFMVVEYELEGYEEVTEKETKEVIRQYGLVTNRMIKKYGG